MEDEPDLAGAVRGRLKAEGYAVDPAADGEEALALDLMLPRVDGLDVLRSLRATGVTTPVLILTARTALEDKVLGLDAGADDYLTKPFAFEELLARVRALTRRDTVDRAGTVLRVPLAGRRSPTTSGTMTSTASPTSWTSTSATCAARWTKASASGSSRRCGAPAIACGRRPSDETPAGSRLAGSTPDHPGAPHLVGTGRPGHSGSPGRRLRPDRPARPWATAAVGLPGSTGAGSAGIGPDPPVGSSRR